MVVPHLTVAGVADALFTVAVFAFLRKVSPGSLSNGAETRIRGTHRVLVALICLSPLGLLASGKAWGEWGAETVRKLVGYIPQGMQKGFSFSALFPSYMVRGFPDVLGYVVSATAGAAVLVIAFKLLGLLRKERRQKAST